MQHHISPWEDVTMLQRKSSLHETRPAILKRLKRAEGHLRSVMKMIETQQP